MNRLPQDLRFAFRSMRRAPGFSAIVVLTLALGIGATTAMYSVVDGVLLSALPFEEPGELVRIYTLSRSEQRSDLNLSPANFASLREEARTLTDVVVYGTGDATLTGAGEPRTLEAGWVSAGFFELLRARPALGRTFRAEENEPGRTDVAVLGHRLWQRLGGGAEILGRTLVLDGVPRTVVGVMGPGFEFPEGRELWLPREHGPRYSAASASGRGGGWLPTLARLRPGATLEEARAELGTIARRLEAEFPATNEGVGFTAVELREDIVGGVRTPLLVLLGAVFVVLLIACANVAGLLLARATTRRGDLAVRAALGAGQGRLARHVVAESLALGVVGGVLGVLLAWWGTGALLALGPEGLPRLEAVRLDRSVLAFSAAMTLLVGVAVGLVPALRNGRPAAAVLREAGRSGRASRGGTRLRRGLVVAELALAVVLLSGAGLLLRSFANLLAVDPGVRAEGLLTFPVELPSAAYDSDDEIVAFYDGLIDSLEGIAGAESAAAVFRLPLSGRYNTSFTVEGRPSSGPGGEGYLEVRSATADYFRTAGIPVLRGRGLGGEDRAAGTPVVVLSASAAARHFPASDPLGQRIRLGIRNEPLTVVGIVGDVPHLGLDREPAPHAYLPFAQAPYRSMNVLVRAAGDPAPLIPAIRAQLRAADAALPLPAFRTFADVVAESLARPRFLTTLLALFAGLALALSAIGIFGLLSFTVAQQTREFGIRIALGASPREVLAMVVKGAARLIAPGLALGIAGALVLARLVESELFGVSASDPATLAGVALVLGATALAASLAPARRAASVQPLVALRQE